MSEPSCVVVEDGPRCTNCDRILDSEGECRAGCSQERRRYDGADIFEDFIAAIQNAEEIGPEGMDYVCLMEKIAAEATRRAAVVRVRLAAGEWCR